MTVLHTLKKRSADVELVFKATLDKIAAIPKQTVMQPYLIPGRTRAGKTHHKAGHHPKPVRSSRASIAPGGLCGAR